MSSEPKSYEAKTKHISYSHEITHKQISDVNVNTVSATKDFKMYTNS